jgi:hypothetical protein
MRVALRCGAGASRGIEFNDRGLRHQQRRPGLNVLDRWLVAPWENAAPCRFGRKSPPPDKIAKTPISPLHRVKPPPTRPIRGVRIRRACRSGSRGGVDPLASGSVGSTACSPGLIAGKLRSRRKPQAGHLPLCREPRPWVRAHARRIGRGDPHTRWRLRRHEGRDPRNSLRRVAGRNLAAQDFSRRERASLTRVVTVGNHVVYAILGSSAINEQWRVGKPNLDG